MTNAKETIIKSALKYLVKMQIEEGSVGFAVDNDHDHDCCWDDVLAWIEAQSSEEDFVKHKKEVLERIAKREREIDKYIKELEALEQQPCDDCISRSELQKTMDSLPLFRFVNNDHEEADDYYNCESVDMVIRNLPSVTPRRDLAETSQDCISREAVIRLVEQYPNIIGNRCSGLIADIKHLPPVTPQYTDEEIDKAQAVEQAYVDKMVELAVEETKRPKGKWIEVEVRNVYATLKCSVCGRVIEPIFDFCKYSYEDIKRSYPYCHCGAEMSGGGEDETDN